MLCFGSTIWDFAFGPNSGSPTFLLGTWTEAENSHPSLFTRNFYWLKSVYAQMHEERVLPLVQLFPLKCAVQICHDHPIPHSFKIHLYRRSRYKELRSWGLCLNLKRKFYRGCLCNLSTVVCHILHWDVTIQVYLINCKSEKVCDINKCNLKFFPALLTKEQYHSVECSVFKSISSDTFLIILYRIFFSVSCNYFYVHASENCRSTYVKSYLSFCNICSYINMTWGSCQEAQTQLFSRLLPSFVCLI